MSKHSNIEIAELANALKCAGVWHMDGVSRSVNDLVTSLNDTVAKRVLSWTDGNTPLYRVRLPTHSALSEWVCFTDMSTRGTAVPSHVVRMLNDYDTVRDWSVNEFNLDDIVTIDDMCHQLLLPSPNKLFTMWEPKHTEYVRKQTVLTRREFTALMLSIGSQQCAAYHAKRPAQRVFNF